LEQLGAPEPGQPGTDHEDADTIVDMAHPGYLRAAANLRKVGRSLSPCNADPP
jgi:hypothetical protein